MVDHTSRDGCMIQLLTLFAFIVVDTDGMVKVLSDKTTDRMLGVHIVGSVNY